MDIKNFLLGFALSFSAFMLSDYTSLFSHTNSRPKTENNGVSSYFNSIGNYFGKAIEQYEQEK